jgi:hypothetical protein
MMNIDASRNTNLRTAYESGRNELHIFRSCRTQTKKARLASRLKCFHNGIILIVNCFQIN